MTTPQFMLWQRRSWTEELVSALFLLLLLCVLRFDALTHFTTHFIGGATGDAGLYIWLAKSNSRDLFELPWFNTQAFFPYTKSLGWSDNFILPSTPPERSMT